VQITMQGQVSFQIAGEVKRENFSADDVKMVMDQSGASEAAAKDALEKTGGDIAEAIVLLSGEKE
jgi:nascent polypeptide-associated complex subunit alpha